LISKAGERPLPLSGMLIGSFTHTRKEQSDPPEHVHANDNLTLDQAWLFVAGGLGQHAGVFSQFTYDGNGRSTAIDEVDLRYARRVELSGRRAIFGLSLNNAPGSSDPDNALRNWATRTSPRPSRRRPTRARCSTAR
jgi:hypothetical protein